MKLLLTFAMGMTIFSKIAQAGIAPNIPNPDNLIVAVTETKGEKTNGNLKKEHDKLVKVLEKKKEGNKTNQYIVVHNQKLE